MKISVTTEERRYNRAARRSEVIETSNGVASLTAEEAKALRKCAGEYGLSVAGMLALVVSYYFGDGCNHFNCEHCGYWLDGCKVPEKGVQTTLPLLDKGSVVVGLP